MNKITLIVVCVNFGYSRHTHLLSYVIFIMGLGSHNCNHIIYLSVLKICPAGKLMYQESEGYSNFFVLYKMMF